MTSQGRRPPRSGRSLGPPATLIALAVSCAHRPSAYDQSLSAAREEERRGETHAAADGYRRAVQLARSDDDKAEALYREAQAWRRTKNDQRSIQLLEALAREHPHTARAPRALLDLGRLLEKQGAVADSNATYLRLVRDYPASPVAESAALAFARLQPPPASTAYHNLRTNQPTGRLDEFLRMRQGISLAEEGRPREAISVFEELASVYPMPKSTLADDALLRSAQLRRELGDPVGSLHVLEVLLAEEVRADLLGSYTRSTRSHARWLQAELWRDELGDDRRALASFLTLTREQPESILTDDAQWQAAFLARHLGDHQTACSLQQAILHRIPESRYAPCSELVCGPTLRASLTEACTEAIGQIAERLRPEGLAAAIGAAAP